MNKIIQITTLTLIFLGAVSCKDRYRKDEFSDPPTPVSATKVNLENVVYYDTYPGTVTAMKEVDLHGQVSGYITGIFFNEGMRVKKGQQLYEIDRSKYAASYDQARANVEIAQTNLEKVEHDYDRYAALSKEDAIAKQKLDYAESDLESARLEVVTAKAELIKAKADLDYSLITAPFDGTIGISQVKLGALVVPGQTLLNSISSDDPMGVDFVIDESQLGRFQDLINSPEKPADTAFTIMMPDNKKYDYPGKISIIDRAFDPQTGTIKVRLDFPNPEHKLRPGMTCIVRIRNSNAGTQLVIPYKAVIEQMGEYFVFVVEGTKAKQVKVSLGTKFGDKVIVSEGLAQGEAIVVDGIQKLHDGSQVEIGSPSSAQGIKRSAH
jgi:membrane fusion protein, multidrug efflux system